MSEHRPDPGADPCAHVGARTRKFGGAIVCDDCTSVIGNWRTDEDAERLVFPAIAQFDLPHDGNAR